MVERVVRDRGLEGNGSLYHVYINGSPKSKQRGLSLRSRYVDPKAKEVTT